MVLINQEVADEVATLVARYRYAVEDSTDAVRAAEAASAQCNDEIQQAADERNRALTERAEQGRKAEEEKQPKEWTARRTEISEIRLSGSEIDEPPAQPPPPVRRRAAYFDEDEDFSDRRWLR